jgi:tetratricopeptide (TPR) repeat protein
MENGDMPPAEVAAATFIAARIERRMGRIHEASELADRGLALAQGAGVEPGILLAHLIQRADLLQLLRRDEEACDALEIAADTVDAFEPENGAPDHVQAQTLMRLSEAAERAGRRELAFKAAVNAAEYARVVATFDPEGARLQAISRARLGDVLRLDDRGEEAFFAYRDALSLFPPDVRPGDIGRMQVARQLVAVLRDLGRDKEASFWLKSESLPG